MRDYKVIVSKHFCKMPNLPKEPCGHRAYGDIHAELLIGKETGGNE